MTHVVNPFSHRLGIIRDWRSRWYVGKTGYVAALRGDVMLRQYLAKRLRGMYVADIIMERGKDTFRIAVHSSRPGMLIGRSGEGIEKLRADIVKEANRKKITLPKDFKLDIIEVASPEASAAIVAQMVMEGLEKRLPFRRVLKGTVEKVMANRDVKGIRIGVSGRLGGADMARREEMRRGNVPLQTLRADVDFAKERANMTYGVIGIKVWIYRGMNFGGVETQSQNSSRPNRDNSRGGYRGGDRSDSRPRTPRTGGRTNYRTTAKPAVNN